MDRQQGLGVLALLRNENDFFGKVHQTFKNVQWQGRFRQLSVLCIFSSAARLKSFQYSAEH